MKGKDLNSGIRGGLWDQKHVRDMRKAVFLFGWLVHRQTVASGLVLRGKPITYGMIAEDTGWHRRTMQRWMTHLCTMGYIEVKYTYYKQMVIRVLHAKKFNPKQLSFPTTFPQSYAPEVAHGRARSGAFKERTETEQKPQRKSRAQKPRRATNLSLRSEQEQRRIVAARDSRIEREAEVYSELHVGTGPLTLGMIRAGPAFTDSVRQLAKEKAMEGAL